MVMSTDEFIIDSVNCQKFLKKTKVSLINLYITQLVVKNSNGIYRHTRGVPLCSIPGR